jgi:hypothetical protein
MLNTINKAFDDLIKDTEMHFSNLNTRVNTLLNAMDQFPMSAKQLMDKLNLKSALSFRKNYINPALEAGLIKMSLPNKPTSKNQKYYRV